MYKIAIALCFAATAAVMPFFLKLLRGEHNLKTLSLKMTLSTLFVLAGIFAAADAAAFSDPFACFMLCGFALSWVGDWLLHIEGKMVKYIIGGVAFLIAHVLFILAYIRTQQRVLPGSPVLSGKEIAAILIMWAAVVVGTLLLKLQLKKLAVPVYIYTLVLMFMFVKAASLGFSLKGSGADGGTAACVLLTLGALLFTVSDATLAVNFFSKKTHAKDVINIVTYYSGQLLLATAIAFVCRGI